MSDGRGKGRPPRLTPEFFAELDRLQSEWRQIDHSLAAYIGERIPTNGKPTCRNTVLWWLAQKRKQS